MEMTSLTDEQIDFYREEGYVLVGRVLDDVTLEALCEEETRFRAQPLKNHQDTSGQGTLFRSQVCNYSQCEYKYELQ